MSDKARELIEEAVALGDLPPHIQRGMEDFLATEPPTYTKMWRGRWTMSDAKARELLQRCLPQLVRLPTWGPALAREIEDFLATWMPPKEG